MKMFLQLGAAIVFAAAALVSCGKDAGTTGTTGSGGGSNNAKIVLAGFDDMPDTVKAIKEGNCNFAIAQKTYKMGWLSLEKLLDAANGKTIEKQIDTGIQLIRKDNVDSYMEDMKKEMQDQAKNSSTTPPAAGKKLTFVMVPKGVHPYYDPCKQGFQDAAKKYGITVEIREPKEFELPQQVEVLENLVSRKVDGIAISAVDDKGLINVIKQATDAGIKVVTFDAPAPSTAALSYIGTLNPEAGYAAGVEFAKLIGNDGEVAILQGGLGASNLNDRYAGFTKALAEKAPNIKMVGREDTQGKLELATSKTENLLSAHPNLKGIFGLSAECIPGAANALKTQNR
jgi:ABC-type sugar transport system substrate-binding protein